MGFFQKLVRLISPAGKTETPVYWIHARCNRCGEQIAARVNLYNDLSVEYEGDQTVYNCHKTLIGEGHCFQRIEVWLTFDQNRQLTDRQISGGTFVEPEESA